MQKMQIQDVKTRQMFQVDPNKNTDWVTTKDGVRVRIHPLSIKTMVVKGQRFDGHTVTGHREMIKV